MYRLYIDETGNADLGASDDPNHRYLSLTGVIIHHGHVRNVVTPRLNQLKLNYFGADPDDPIIFHRKDILRRRHPFHVLRDAAVAARFDQDLLTLLTDCEYVALTAVIDKLDHLNRYKVWRYEPYHYCLAVLIERYCMWLNRRGFRGDVMAEVRGGKPDQKLEKSFARIYKHGTEWLSIADTQRPLTSRKLKMRPKIRNISGLQISDILAHPSALYVRSVCQGDVTPAGFGKQISDLLVASKFDRSATGRIPGYGFKWLP